MSGVTQTASALDTAAVEEGASQDVPTADRLAEIEAIVDADQQALAKAEFDSQLEDAGMTLEDLSGDGDEVEGGAGDGDEAASDKADDQKSEDGVDAGAGGKAEVDPDEGGTVSQKRFNEVYGKLKFMEGLVAATKGNEGKKDEGGQDQKSEVEKTQDRLAKIDEELNAIDEAYQDGDITVEEKRSKERKLNREYSKLEDSIEEADPKTVAKKISDDPYVRDNTARLETDNPWLFPKDKADHAALSAGLAALTPEARKIAERQPNINSGNPAEMAIATRFFVVELAKRNGLAAKFGYDPDAKKDDPGKDQQDADKAALPGNKGGKQKAKAEDLPPDISAAGSPAPMEGVTEADIENMSQSQLEEWMKKNPGKADAMLGLA